MSNLERLVTLVLALVLDVIIKDIEDGLGPNAKWSAPTPKTRAPNVENRPDVREGDPCLMLVGEFWLS